MDIRERILGIFDEASFVEIDAFLQSRQSTSDDSAKGDGVLSGYGTINGRLVYVAAQDRNFLGGALGEIHASKIARAINMAVSVGAPVFLVFDSQGARLKEGLLALNGYGEIMQAVSNASGMVPVISVCCGNAYGLTSYALEMADFVIMTDNGRMAVTTPAVIKASDKNAGDEVGNANFNEKVSGNADLVCTDAELPYILRKLVSLLPDNNLTGAPQVECTDDLNRSLDINTDDLDIRNWLLQIADIDSYFELKQNYATEIITAFIRLNGRVVGTVANNGLLTGEAMSKAARFVRFCDTFNIPVLTLTNAEGFVKNQEEEENGIVRNAAKLAHAFAGCTVPKVNVVLNKAYGGAYVLMNSKHLGSDLVYALENAVIAPLSDVASAVMLFQDEIATSDDPVKTREEKAQEYAEKYANPYEAAKLGYVDDIIRPEELRVRVISAFEMLLGKRKHSLPRKHINVNL
ncbi:MAG TPA: methylmalonyl-CoA carboxyltransferase [Clostridiaceae bacterium]|jgi:acetyl-CoA carboxylase carboxyltransferase component|nr:methylmalonyl-CoA carboxyltransferase [Clostridiaceae bacterium]